MLLLMPHININVSIGKFHSKKPLHKSQMNYPLPDLGLGQLTGWGQSQTIAIQL